MGLLNSFVVVLIFAQCVFADEIIKNTCDDKDGDEYIACVKTTLEDFFKEHSGGVPDKGIKSMDPATVDHVDVLEDAIHIKYHYTNLKVTGFKDAKVSEFSEVEIKKDLDYKVTLTIKFDYVAEGSLRIEMLDKDKTVSGDVKYEGGAVGVITYDYETKKVDGKDVYEIGPEQITCESQHAKATAKEDLIKAIENDSDLQAVKEEYEKIEKDHQARAVCGIAKEVLKTVVENLRILARTLKHEQ